MWDVIINLSLGSWTWVSQSIQLERFKKFFSEHVLGENMLYKNYG